MLAQREALTGGRETERGRGLGALGSGSLPPTCLALGGSLLSTRLDNLLWISMTFSMDRTALALGLCCKTFSGRGSSWKMV